jgi:hypothetical protein
VAASFPPETFEVMAEKDAQQERREDVAAILELEDTEKTPKPVPITDIEEPPVTGAVAKSVLEGIGGPNDKTCDTKPKRRDVEIQTDCNLPTPKSALTKTEESDNQFEKEATLSPNLALKVTSLFPTKDPNKETIAVPETGTATE